MRPVYLPLSESYHCHVVSPTGRGPHPLVVLLLALLRLWRTRASRQARVRLHVWDDPALCLQMMDWHRAAIRALGEAEDGELPCRRLVRLQSHIDALGRLDKRRAALLREQGAARAPYEVVAR